MCAKIHSNDLMPESVMAKIIHPMNPDSIDAEKISRGIPNRGWKLPAIARKYISQMKTIKSKSVIV
jgi:hypothetical protein